MLRKLASVECIEAHQRQIGARRLAPTVRNSSCSPIKYVIGLGDPDGITSAMPTTENCRGLNDSCHLSGLLLLLWSNACIVHHAANREWRPLCAHRDVFSCLATLVGPATLICPRMKPHKLRHACKQAASSSHAANISELVDDFGPHGLLRKEMGRGGVCQWWDYINAGWW